MVTGMKLSRRHAMGAAAGVAILPRWAAAQSRAETLRYVTGNTINTLDATAYGTTRESFGLSMNVYDRLFRFGRKRYGGDWIFDADTIEGELAQGYQYSPDHLTITITLRPDATWHDGSPVTAEDIKWSLDRAVAAKSLAAPQLSTGSLTSTDQFRITGDHRLELSLPKPVRLALANLCVPYAIMVNSKLAKQHASEADPWAQEWMKANTAASGAYTVESYKAGESVILRRNPAWKGGAQPGFARVIMQTVPEPATRANLIERGDADLAIDLAANDILAMTKAPKVKVVSIPQTNGFTHITMNTQMAPFDNVQVRQAVAAALPYDDMFQAALFGRGAKLYGADWTVPPDSRFPQPMPLRTDPARAKQLLAEAGMASGFSVPFAISAGQAATAEPAAALVKEALGRVGIAVDIQKKPDAEFNTAEAQKTLPFFLDGATAWLPSTDYYFRLYFTRDQRWNFASWKSPAIEQLAAAAQFETDAARYDDECKKMIETFVGNVPLVMLWQPSHDAAMAPSVDGYTYEFYRQADFRTLKRV